MRNRCYEPKNNRFYRYGARGITVCEDWLESFENFRDWALANGYSDEKSIDRIDNNGNYCPENCKWSTQKDQARNRRTSCVVYGKTIAEWAELLKVDYNLLRQRISRDGLSLEEALAKPVRPSGDRKRYIPYENFNLQDFL
jgi:hypothetical protein